MKAVVVGASGYLGNQLLKKLSTTMKVLGTSTRGGDGLEALDLGNLSVSGLGWLPDEGVIFLSAAISSPDVCARQPEFARSVNIEGTSTLIEYALERRLRVVFFSSDTVYGETAMPFSEGYKGTPCGDYALMKKTVEDRFSGHSDFKAVRLSYVVSRHDKFTSYLSASAQKGIEVEVFHPFDRAVVYRNDVVDGLVGLAQQWDSIPGSVINFGGPKVVSRVDYVRSIQAVFPNLRYRVTEPGQEFFQNRPRIIAMESPLLARLCDRPIASLDEIWKKEFATEGVS